MEFLLQRYGTASGFPFVLQNADLAIQCGEFNSPSFYVTFRSEALWRESARALHERFIAWAEDLGFDQYRPESLGRVDFTFDYFLPVVDFDEDSVVTLSAVDSKHRRDKRLRGVSFGQSDVVLRIYDKVAEILEKSLKVWFFDLWGRSEDVWRIEWQVRKAVLRRFAIRTFADLADQQGDVLRYLVREHDSLRVKTEDPNRSRWPLHPLWIDLAKRIETLEAQGVYREIDPEAAIRERLARLAISMHGYLKRVAALHGLQRGQDEVTHQEALERLRALMWKLYDPLTWPSDVRKRMEQMRLGQWNTSG